MESQIIVTEQQSSIEITKNSKGFTWSIKAYGHEDTLDLKLTKLKNTAIAMERNLEGYYKDKV